MLKKKLKLVSQHIWSRDKTGIQNVPKEIRVVGVKNVHILQQLSAEQGETLMILTFINAMQDQGYLEAEGTWKCLGGCCNKRIHSQIKVP